MTVAGVQASVKARRPPVGSMTILMPQKDFQLNSTVQGVHNEEVISFYPDAFCGHPSVEARLLP